MTVDETRTLMDRDKVLKVVRYMELDKVDLVFKMNMAVKFGKIQGSAVPFVMEVEKLQAFDAMWLRDGVDEADIQRGFNEYELGKSEEFKALSEDCRKKAEEMQSKMTPPPKAAE